MNRAPASPQALVHNAQLVDLLLFEQVEGNVTQGSEVLEIVVFTETGFIFPKGRDASSGWPASVAGATKPDSSEFGSAVL